VVGRTGYFGPRQVISGHHTSLKFHLIRQRKKHRHTAFLARVMAQPLSITETRSSKIPSANGCAMGIFRLRRSHSRGRRLIWTPNQNPSPPNPQPSYGRVFASKSSCRETNSAGRPFLAWMIRGGAPNMIAKHRPKVFRTAAPITCSFFPIIGGAESHTLCKHPPYSAPPLPARTRRQKTRERGRKTQRSLEEHALQKGFLAANFADC